MPRSKRPHPRIECARAHYSDDLWKRRIVGPWVDVYADIRRQPARELDGRYVIENPKVDEVLKIHRYKGLISVVKTYRLTVNGPKAVSEVRYDGARTVHCLLLEDGTSLCGRFHFRAKSNTVATQKDKVTK